ncbi:hypothetical protein [Mycoplasmopsis primatum]|uniref:hypothetical protein n=1 Tax=Mycoplasmopsis primatum TaxID=55604 RepID=UPI000A768791|nr:hypothetical protein [Mycoplasmopsis primatum]
MTLIDFNAQFTFDLDIAKERKLFHQLFIASSAFLAISNDLIYNSNIFRFNYFD